MSRGLTLILFLALVVGGGLIIGAVTTPGEWYARLDKPPFTPPGPLFPIVWTGLYVLIAVAGWRVWRREPGGLAMMLWWMQLILNFAWSPLFFAAHQIGLALVVVELLFGVVAGFIAAARPIDALAAWLMAPYAVWVAFAALLNGAILSMN
jgi:tryptophan-rich sensory protein